MSRDSSSLCRRKRRGYELSIVLFPNLVILKRNFARCLCKQMFVQALVIPSRDLKRINEPGLIVSLSQKKERIRIKYCVVSQSCHPEKELRKMSVRANVCSSSCHPFKGSKENK